MAAVSSVLSESTTMISSAQATDCRASPMSAASSLAMIVTDSFGTRVYYAVRARVGSNALTRGRESTLEAERQRELGKRVGVGPHANINNDDARPAPGSVSP